MRPRDWGEMLTDELREWIGTISWLDDSVSSAHKNVLAIADRIDREHRMAMEKVAAEANALPIVENGGEWQVMTEKVFHYHAPTVEDVLREFAQEMNENLGMYTGEAIDADEWRDADAKTVEKYAAKLRLAEGVDE